MKAVQLIARDTLEVREIPTPTPGPGELLIRVRAAGLCETDVHLYHMRWPVPVPLTLGHEFSGEVAGLGPGVTRFALGDPVVADPNITCGRCQYCIAGRPNLCRELRHLGIQTAGADAEYVLVPVRNSFRLPLVQSFEAAALTEPFACGLHALRRLQLRAGEDVLIFGDGFFSLVYSQLARALDAGRVIVFGHRPARMARAREEGADLAVDERSPEAGDIARSLSEGLGPAVVVDTLGTAGSFERAIDLAAPGGRIGIFGAIGESPTLDARQVLRKELDVLGLLSSSGAWPGVFELLSAGRINPAALVSQVFELEQLADAFALKADPSNDKTKLVVRV